MDAAVRELFHTATPSGSGAADPPVAVVAVGGYGGRDLTPGSDVDLLFVHQPGAEDEAERAASAVLYPLWDAGLRVSHAVRTPPQCRDEAAARFDSLTSMLASRPLSGPLDLAGAARAAAREVAGADLAGFAARLREHREERGARFASLAERLEPDLKEALGGVRDWQLIRWLRAARDDAADDEGPAYVEAFGAPDPARACARLLSVRLALHVANGGSSNRLSSEHHGAVAAMVRPEPLSGWEPADALMRDVADAGRAVDGFVAGRLGVPAGGDAPSTASAAGRWLAAVSADPAWRDVRGRPQRDPYHRFPVDLHLTRAAQEVERLLREPPDAFDAEAARSVRDPESLILGALLHDIGKVGKRSHVRIGEEIAPHVLDRVGVHEERRDDVLFLVREHLLLSDTATRRNLADEDLIIHVAARAHDPARLAMLYLLTVADALATGPGASSPWRMTLIRELTAKVSRVFERGLMDPDRARRLADAEREVRTALAAGGHDPELVEAFLATAPSGYVQWVDPADAPAHVDLALPAPGPDEVRTHVVPGRSPGTYLLMVGARDRLGLLAAVAGSLSLAGLSILAAQAFTTADGVALDAFDVRGAFEEHVGPERWERFEAVLAEALRGADLEPRIRDLRAHYRPPPAGIPVAVRLDEDVSDYFTVVEVGAADRLGLLFDLARTFARQRVDVHLAKVATYGPRVIDAFYVTDEEGRKLSDEARAEALRAALAAAAG